MFVAAVSVLDIRVRFLIHFLFTTVRKALYESIERTMHTEVPLSGHRS